MLCWHRIIPGQWHCLGNGDCKMEEDPCQLCLKHNPDLCNTLNFEPIWLGEAEGPLRSYIFTRAQDIPSSDPSSPSNPAGKIRWLANQPKTTLGASQVGIWTQLSPVQFWSSSHNTAQLIQLQLMTLRWVGWQFPPRFQEKTTCSLGKYRFSDSHCTPKRKHLLLSLRVVSWTLAPTKGKGGKKQLS